MERRRLPFPLHIASAKPTRLLLSGERPAFAKPQAEAGGDEPEHDAADHVGQPMNAEIEDRENDRRRT